MSTTQRNDARTLVVSRQHAEVLREQTLIILEANAGAFEDISLMDPIAVETAATVLRDAFTILDTLGWTADEAGADGAITVTVSAGHIDQLRLRRADLAMAIVDDLEVRDEMTTTQEIEEIDTEIQRFRHAAYHLWEILLDWQQRQEN